MSRSSVLKPYPASVRETTGGCIVARLFHIAAIWQMRWHGRRELGSLDDEQLKDAGISRLDALREARKPFWRP